MALRAVGEEGRGVGVEVALAAIAEERGSRSGHGQQGKARPWEVGGYEGNMPGNTNPSRGLVWFEPELAGRGEGDRRGGDRGRDGGTGSGRRMLFFPRRRTFFFLYGP